LGDFDKALADWDQVIRLYPDSAWYYYRRGLVYEELGKINDAIRDFETAISLSSDQSLIQQAEQEIEKLKK